jgi:sirohydrochlorin ferrochelatase
VVGVAQVPPTPADWDAVVVAMCKLSRRPLVEAAAQVAAPGAITTARVPEVEEVQVAGLATRAVILPMCLGIPTIVEIISQ